MVGDRPQPLVRDLAHDLLNPLSSLLGFLSLLLAPDAKDPVTPRQRRMLVAMDRACSHLLGTMRDLAEFSRGQDGLWEPPTEPTDPAAVVMGLLPDHRDFTALRRISVETQMDPGTPSLRAVDRLITRFFDALFRTLERLTPERGKIVVRLGPDGEGGVRGALESEGEERTEEYWKAAFAATLGDRRPAEGYSALGPALARRIALHHGGTLEAGSRPGGGTVFRFRFPSSRS